MADLPVTLSRPDLTARLFAIVDSEGKLLQALDSLGPIRDRDVVVVDVGSTARAAQLTSLGARVRNVALADIGSLDEHSVDVVVAPWAGFTAGDPAFDEQLDAVRRIVRPGGRLLVVQDYGRDAVRDLVGPPAGMSPRARSRDEWFARRGFRIRVLHCWWTFESMEEARAFLSEAFGEAGAAAAASLERPRLSHKIGVYHVSIPGPEPLGEAEDPGPSPEEPEPR